MNFVLDMYIYLVNPSQVANLELDLNQVTSSGKTIMFDTQCSSYSKTWEYTVVTGGNKDHWTRSNIGCNPLTWKVGWHHIQIAYHRDANGIVTHDWLNFDGTPACSRMPKATPPGTWVGRRARCLRISRSTERAGAAGRPRLTSTKWFITTGSDELQVVVVVTKAASHRLAAFVSLDDLDRLFLIHTD